MVEMTRKRTRESLAHVLCEPCPPVPAAREIKTAQTVCYDVLREILREAAPVHRAREYRIVGRAKRDRPRSSTRNPALAQLIDFIGKPVSLQVEDALPAGTVRHHFVVKTLAAPEYWEPACAELPPPTR